MKNLFIIIYLVLYSLFIVWLHIDEKNIIHTLPEGGFMMTGGYLDDTKMVKAGNDIEHYLDSMNKTLARAAFIRRLKIHGIYYKIDAIFM